MMVYPKIKITWHRMNWWAVWHFEILGRICKAIGHHTKDLAIGESYPGHYFCWRCRTHYRP